MPKICYIHLGLHKTATTSFQETCANNSEILEKNGITYPIFQCSAANQLKIINHSIPIFSLYFGKPYQYHINKRWGVAWQARAINSSYMQQFEEYLESSENLLLSGEDISMLGEGKLYTLIEKIKSYGYKIEATALLRSPYSMLCSQLQETIKMGKYSNFISLNNSAKLFSQDQFNGKANIVKKLQAAFGKSINFHSFEHACTDTLGPVGYLLREFIKQEATNFKYSKGNESYFNLTIRIQNELNKIENVFTNADKQRINPDHTKLGTDIDNNLSFTGKFLLTEHEYNLAEEFINEEREAMHQLTGIGEMLNQSIQFSKPIYD